MMGRAGFILLILLTGGVFAATLFFNALAGDPAISGGIFQHGVQNVSAMYQLELTPAPWTFSVWGIIWLMQACWVAYSVVNICRKVQGSPAYDTPAVLTPDFYIVAMANFLSNITWLFVWDRELLWVSTGVLVAITVSCWYGVALASRSLSKAKADLAEEGRSWEATFISVFVLNGLALYGSWAMVATVLNLGSALAYKLTPPLPQETTSLVCLTLVITAFLCFLVVDVSFAEAVSRNTLSPYLLVLWVVAGIVSKRWDPKEWSSIMVAMLGGLAVLGLVLKLIVSYWRRRREGQYRYRNLHVWSTPGNEIYPTLSVK